jgi:hypothetical protein
MVMSLNTLRLFNFGGRWKIYRVNKKKLRKAVAILISVVLGALLLAGLYALFQNQVIPILGQKIQDMFNYKG